MSSSGSAPPPLLRCMLTSGSPHELLSVTYSNKLLLLLPLTFTLLLALLDFYSRKILFREELQTIASQLNVWFITQDVGKIILHKW